MKTSLPAFLCLGLLCFPSFLTVSSRARAEDPRFPNSEDLRHVKGIASPLLSPDGQEVLFTMTDSTGMLGRLPVSFVQVNPSHGVEVWVQTTRNTCPGVVGVLSSKPPTAAYPIGVPTA